MLIFVGGGLAWDGWLAEQPATENYRGVPMLAILLVLLVRGFFEIRAMAAAAGVKLLVPAGDNIQITLFVEAMRIDNSEKKVGD